MQLAWLTDRIRLLNLHRTVDRSPHGPKDLTAEARETHERLLKETYTMASKG